MSIILEALRKAAAEREKGPLAGLYHPGAGHRGPVGEEANEGDELRTGRPSAARIAWAIGVAAALATAAGALVWAWGRPGHSLAPQSAAPGAVVSSTPQPERPATPHALSGVAASSPLTHAPKAPASAPPRPGLPDRPLAQSSLASAETPQPPTLDQLPATWRQQLPPLQFGGAMASNDPASRLVFLNGQVFREGETVTEGLKVETIAHRWAVLNWRGQRFLVRY